MGTDFIFWKKVLLVLQSDQPWQRLAFLYLFWTQEIKILFLLRCTFLYKAVRLENLKKNVIIVKK